MSKHIGSNLNEFLEEEGLLAHTEEVANNRMHGVVKITDLGKDFNLHINHPTLGDFVITRMDNRSLFMHELDELVGYIKERLGFTNDQHNQSSE
jgi:hypothetical protein